MHTLFCTAARSNPPSINFRPTAPRKMMLKVSSVAIVTLALFPHLSSAFAPHPPQRNAAIAPLAMGKKGGMGGMGGKKGKQASDGGGGGGGGLMEVELVAEPEGGEMVEPIPGTTVEKAGYTLRLKDMGPVGPDDEAHYLNEELGRTVHNFWLTALADGSEIQKTRGMIMKESAKNANFPGFRPGQIPPYAQPKMTTFAVQEVLVTSCQEAIKAFGVNEINEGQLGAVTFNEDVDDLSKAYHPLIKKCPSVPFTANFRATFDPDAVREVESEVESEDASEDASEDTGETATEE